MTREYGYNRPRQAYPDWQVTREAELYQRQNWVLIASPPADAEWLTMTKRMEGGEDEEESDEWDWALERRGDSQARRLCHGVPDG